MNNNNIEKDLSILNKTIDKKMSNLIASDDIKKEIIKKSYLTPRKRTNFFHFLKKPLLVFSSLVIILLIYNQAFPKNITTSTPKLFNSISASTNEENNLSVARNVGQSLMITEDESINHLPIWISNENSFPYLIHDHSIYRLLNIDGNKAWLTDQKLGETLSEATVADNSMEHSSNTLPIGTAIYGVKNFESIFIGAVLNDKILIFQKYANEKIEHSILNTIKTSEIKSIYVNLLGEITEEKNIQKFIELLQQNVVSVNAIDETNSNFILINYKNGLIQQLDILDDDILGYGVYKIQNLNDNLEKLVN